MSEQSSAQPLGIRHVARALVFDPADRLLLIEYESVHAIEPDGKPLRFWFMPGGGLEPGEDHVTACRRELSEEIGRADCPIGPQVAACDGPFHLFRQSRDARERYFLVRLPDDRVDTSRLMETEDNPLHGTRWWSVSELLSTEARIEPAGLGELAARLVAGHVPEAPIILNWRQT
ncbi:RNA pyrophosphohydrolase [Methylobacterium cerastii]|uniref:RNA pyrophosphohydrolase n=1 Tax=Methylobacterium cerastii TaxID=932741 RepID=A0ABQ4QB12_9HYPH|nr:NUDIX domain-containing protein [Methylobacterium cerastii]TXM98606.1 NUDIX domain-containing protein [Methylobacterium sp. WL122]GJD42408.1 RNA pyrophosphohydrolase [Methylobacterium cerastii]